MISDNFKRKYMAIGYKAAQRQLNEWGGEDYYDYDNEPVDIDISEGEWVKFNYNGEILYGVVIEVEEEVDREYGYSDGITAISIKAIDGDIYDFSPDYEIEAAQIESVSSDDLPHNIVQQLLEIEEEI